MLRCSTFSSALVGSLGSILLVSATLSAQEPRLLADIFPGPSSSFFSASVGCLGGPQPTLPPPGFFLVGDRDAVFMKATDGANGAELWTVEGESNRVMMVADLFPGPDSGLGDCPTPNTTVIDGVLYVTADDGVHGFEPWRSDGTAAGTFMLADLNPGSDGTSTRAFVRSGEHVYFAAGSGAAERGIWRTDLATGSMTELVFGTGNGQVGAAPLFGTDDYVLFSRGIPSGIGGIIELWRTDGTPDGTFLLDSAGNGIFTAQVSAFVEFATYTYYFRQINSSLLLRRTNGLTDELVTEVIPITSPSLALPRAAWVVNEQILFFVRRNGSRELWRSDGTAAGTEPLGLPLFDDFRDDLTTNLDGRALVFAASTPEHGLELWRTDGTVAGTVLIADQVPGPDDSFLPWRVRDPNGGVLFAQAADTATAPHLFRLDSAARALTDLGSLCPTASNCIPTDPALLRGDLIYAGFDPERGREPLIREGVGFAGLPIPTVGSVGMIVLTVLLAAFGLAGLRVRA